MSTANSREPNQLQRKMLQFSVMIHDALQLNCSLCDYLERRLRQLETRKIQQEQQQETATNIEYAQRASHPNHPSSAVTTGYYSSSSSPASAAATATGYYSSPSSSAPAATGYFSSPSSPAPAATGYFSSPSSPAPAATGFYSSSPSPCSPYKSSTYNDALSSALTPKGMPQPLTSTPYHYHLDSFRSPVKAVKKSNISDENEPSFGCKRISCPNCKSILQIEFTVKQLPD